MCDQDGKKVEEALKSKKVIIKIINEDKCVHKSGEVTALNWKVP